MITKDPSGATFMLRAELSDGTSWGPHGDSYPVYHDESERPSPSFPPMVLSHLSEKKQLMGTTSSFSTGGVSEVVIAICNSISNDLKQKI